MRKPVQIRLTPKSLEMLDEMSSAFGQTRTGMIELAVKSYWFENRKKVNELRNSTDNSQQETQAA